MTKAQKFRRRFGDPSKYTEQNLVAARRILEQAEPGEDGPVTWARGILVAQTQSPCAQETERAGE